MNNILLIKKILSMKFKNPLKKVKNFQKIKSKENCPKQIYTK